MTFRLLFATLVVVGTLGLTAPVTTAHVPTGLAPAASAATFNQPAARTFKNCTALNKVYPHGVSKPGARDHVSGSTQRVTNFKKSLPLYRANAKSDRDKDGIACEKL